jgi:hypothetical protein
MTKQRKQSRSPDRMLRQASVSLGVLEGTLLDIRDGLESMRGVPFLSRTNWLQAIDELGHVSNELSGTRQEIGKARSEIRRRRASKRPKPN